MWKLQMYREPTPTFDNRAVIITCTYAGGTLALYTVHPVKSDRFEMEYHHCLVNGWYMLGSRDQFAAGATAFRNACEWASEQRRRVLDDAHARLARC